MRIPTTSSVANALLSDRSFDMEFGGFLSAHHKHAVTALQGLGASDERIQEFWDDHTTRTEYDIHMEPVQKPWDQVKPATEDQWTAWRGKKVEWQAQVLLMDQELQKLDGDTDALVQKYAPELLDGIAGALTHGIIHTGWALDNGVREMITEGLAYLNFCFVGVAREKLRSNQHQESNPFDSFVRVSKTFEIENLSETWVQPTKAKYDSSFHPELVISGFQWQVAKLMYEPNRIVTDLPSWVQELNENTWESLYRAITYIFLASRDAAGHGNFVVLHLLTSLWGLEQVCRSLERTCSDEEALAHTRRALGQYYAVANSLLSAGATGYPSSAALESVHAKFLPSTSNEDFDWKPLVARGIAEVEEHNIKLVYIMRELWKRYGGWTGFTEAAQAFTLTPNIKDFIVLQKELLEAVGTTRAS